MLKRQDLFTDKKITSRVNRHNKQHERNHINRGENQGNGVWSEK